MAFCIDKFITARCIRGKIFSRTIDPRPAAVHFCDIAHTAVPSYVLAFLGTSSKCVPTRALPCYSTFMDSVHNFTRDLVRKSVTAGFASQRVDPLRGMRRRFFKQTSSWQPRPEAVPDGILDSCASIRTDLAFNFWQTQRKLFNRLDHTRGNISHGDTMAIQWLKNKKNLLLDVPTDKNLGVAVVSRTLYNSLANVQLQKCYSRSTPLILNNSIDRIKSLTVEACDFAVEFHLIKPDHVDYLYCLFSNWRLPRIRCLMKIHKPELDVRLICSGTSWITNPHAVALATWLQPTLTSFESIALDTGDVINSLEQTSLNTTDAIGTYDVEKLYLMLDHEFVKWATRDLLSEYYSRVRCRHWGAWVEFLLLLLNIILSAQFSTFDFVDGQGPLLYFQSTGITTGLSCATQIANLVMVGADRKVAATLGANLKCYKRFVDDAIVIATSAALLDTAFQAFNEYHSCIKVTRDKDDDHDQRVSFLDLDVSISGGKLLFQTFRKKLCSYDYTPFNSCHAPSVFGAIVAGELVRLLRTNSCENTFSGQVGFFFSKLHDRGYDIGKARRFLAHYSWKNRDIILKKNSAVNCVGKEEKTIKTIVPFKLQFSPFCTGIEIGKTLFRHTSELPANIRSMLKFIVCNTTSPNLFRLRYDRFF